MIRQLCIAILCSFTAFGQVSTRTELNTDSRSGDIRSGFYQIARPYEVSMTVNLWGEVNSQGMYIIPTTTDIVALLSYSGGVRETANMEEVLLYRAIKDAKDGKLRQMRILNVQSIVEGKAATVPLMPGDMIVVKKLPTKMGWFEIASIVTTFSSVVVLGITIYNLVK
jgi:hypothetical protein